MRPVRMADNLTTFMCRLSRNLGASTCWGNQGLSRPVMGLLYLPLVTLVSFTMGRPIIPSQKISGSFNTLKMRRICFI
jgi:hypothetical protein